MKQRRLMGEINVVPYIDVMLVLLVIFMVTAPLIQTASIDLPSVGKAAAPPVAPLEVIIRPEQKLALIDRSQGNGQEIAINRSDLAERIRDARSRHPDQAVLIAGDKNIRYEEVLKVMDELQRQQVAKIGLLVQPQASAGGS